MWPNALRRNGSGGETAVDSQNFSTANDPYFRDPYTKQWSLTIERELDRNNALRVTYSGSHSVKLTTAPDLNQIQPNTIGFANLPRTARPFPNWFRVNTRDMGGDASYHDLTVQFKGRVLNGLHYTSSYNGPNVLITSNSFTRANSGQFNEELPAEQTTGSTVFTCAVPAAPFRFTDSQPTSSGICRLGEARSSAQT